MPTGTQYDNRILAGVAPETLATLSPETLSYAAGDVLIEQGQLPEFVFFPHANTVTSIVRSTVEGATVEAGIVAGEGLLSVHSVIAEPSPVESEGMVQLAGEVSRVSIASARDCFERDPLFRDNVLAYTSHFINELAQNSVCNRLHAIEQRLAKWLLTVRDRHASDELRLTHEFLSHMLGVHRPGVTVATHTLEADGLIASARNRITIRDRDGLVSRSCECYDVLHTSLLKLRGT